MHEKSAIKLVFRHIFQLNQIFTVIPSLIKLFVTAELCNTIYTAFAYLLFSHRLHVTSGFIRDQFQVFTGLTVLRNLMCGGSSVKILSPGRIIHGNWTSFTCIHHTSEIPHGVIVEACDGVHPEPVWLNMIK